jgi:hypothetical protein
MAKDFIEYPHLERLGTDGVEGIYLGQTHIFPKIDGTNASFWWDTEANAISGGSRTRILSLDKDNAGFLAWLLQQRKLNALAAEFPQFRFYGEWLVPHSLKTYRDSAWRQLYLFDVLDVRTAEFLHYDVYSEILKARDVEYIPCIATAKNASYEQLTQLRDRNFYLIEENSGCGEGIVIKQYGWKNKFGRQTWAKLITNSFKDKHIKEMGGSVIKNDIVEEDIADECVTEHLVDKILAKIRTEKPDEGFTAKDIPRLLNSAFHDLVTEELWDAVKKRKNPTINFKTLQTCCYARVKQLKPEVFGR